MTFTDDDKARAEKILQSVHTQQAGGPNALSFIESELKAACDEAFEAGFQGGKDAATPIHCCVSDVCDLLPEKLKAAVDQAIDDIALGLREHEVTKRIRDEAIEKAAQVCDRPVDEPLTSRRPGYFLAEQIRALKDSQ